MGIKGLWTVLGPYSEKKSLYEIRGETLAIDLSGWVCDSQKVIDYHVQPHLYLRNLFFRTTYLLLADVKPVFVLEGDAPELKRDVMAARNAIQFKDKAGCTSPTEKKKPGVARKRFRSILRECENLLKCMGVSCIKGNGEAEATCAQLNAQGLVDAVISQDSDCFGYGASRVYRNFSVSNSAGGGAMQGSIDCYDADKMFEQNGFGRNKMVALALLCGCDYGVGAVGSSIATVISFLHTISDSEIIPRLFAWVKEPCKYEELEYWVSIKGRCDLCGHTGRTHLKNGCSKCGTLRSCIDNSHKEKLSANKREISLRQRALGCGSIFPDQKIIDEFLNVPNEDFDFERLQPSAPSLIQFVKLMKTKLEWSERYCVEKFLPLLTRWHLKCDFMSRTIQPIAIKKKRNPKGVPSYVVVWGDVSGEYEGLIPDDQFEADEDSLSAWTTTERQDLMKSQYPELTTTYENSIKKPSKEKKTRIRKKKEPSESKKRNNNNLIEDDLEKINISFKNMSITQNDSKLNVSISVIKLKRKIKSQTKLKKQNTIDDFLTKRRRSTKKLMNSLRDSFNNMSINDVINDKENIPKKLLVHKNSMLQKSTEDFDETDISDIIDNIVTKAPTYKMAHVNNNLVKLVFSKHNTPKKSRKSVLKCRFNNCSTPNDSPVHNKINKNCDINVNKSYFFETVTEKNDLFEISTEFNYNYSYDCDKTVEYSLDLNNYLQE